MVSAKYPRYKKRWMMPRLDSGEVSEPLTGLWRVGLLVRVRLAVAWKRSWAKCSILGESLLLPITI